MRYLTIDAELNGTGIRDTYSNEYLPLDNFSFETDFINKIKNWLKAYESEHYKGFTDSKLSAKLDLTGLEITKTIQGLLTNDRITYYSAAQMKNLY